MYSNRVFGIRAFLCCCILALLLCAPSLGAPAKGKGKEKPKPNKKPTFEYKLVAWDKTNNKNDQYYGVIEYDSDQRLTFDNSRRYWEKAESREYLHARRYFDKYIKAAPVSSVGAYKKKNGKEEYRARLLGVTVFPTGAAMCTSLHGHVRDRLYNDAWRGSLTKAAVRSHKGNAIIAEEQFHGDLGTAVVAESKLGIKSTEGGYFVVYGLYGGDIVKVKTKKGESKKQVKEGVSPGRVDPCSICQGGFTRINIQYQRHYYTGFPEPSASNDADEAADENYSDDDNALTYDEMVEADPAADEYYPDDDNALTYDEMVEAEATVGASAGGNVAPADYFDPDIGDQDMIDASNCVVDADGVTWMFNTNGEAIGYYDDANQFQYYYPHSRKSKRASMQWRTRDIEGRGESTTEDKKGKDLKIEPPRKSEMKPTTCPRGSTSPKKLPEKPPAEGKSGKPQKSSDKPPKSPKKPGKKKGNKL